ncbi:hypothetical protein [Mangrovicoccus ximenensis]|uniref:hypothetical protein n=1 Tax=Mangrovicoccus ximenensis TaxID=1911570 RepID=UPI0011AE7D86|nr:hypothetical protein [Mangrovicoccus ximenensis]
MANDGPLRVTVEWEKAVPFDTSKRAHLYTMRDATYALYMLLEREAGSSSAELMYIGIVKSAYRDLYQRMTEHQKDWIGRLMASGSAVTVKFGHLWTTGEATSRLLEDVESALVFGRNPPENTAKMKSYTLYEDVIVTNRGAGKYLARTYDTALQRKTGGTGIPQRKS